MNFLHIEVFRCNDEASSNGSFTALTIYEISKIIKIMRVKELTFILENNAL